jgi:hypothetical protein
VPSFNPDFELAKANAEDALKKGSRSTPETWVVAALVAIAAIAWITLTVTRSHHTAVTPSAVSSPAALRSAAPAP